MTANDYALVHLLLAGFENLLKSYLIYVYITAIDLVFVPRLSRRRART